MSTRSPALLHVAHDECIRLVRNHPVHLGRIGFADADGHPLVLPVNYRLDGENVVIRVAHGSVLADVAAGQRVAFEVDDVDPAWEEGWSVVFRGSLEPASSPEEEERLSRLGLRPWAGNDRVHYLVVRTESVTGRRIM
jgi:uncharacterized protein